MSTELGVTLFPDHSSWGRGRVGAGAGGMVGSHGSGTEKPEQGRTGCAQGPLSTSGLP